MSLPLHAARPRRMRVTRSRTAATADTDWKANLVVKQEAISALAASLKRVAVLGIKTADKAEQPAYHVPEYLAAHGVAVVPVPVYYPDVTEILGQRVYRRVTDVPGQLDCVCVFRKPEDVTAHVEDILAAKPKCVWLQLGIRNDAAAEVWAKAGLLVVQDRCLLIEHRRARL